LDQIRLILVTVIRVAEPGAAKDLAVRQQLVWKALQSLPQLDFRSIHIDQQGARDPLPEKWVYPLHALAGSYKVTPVG
jgi:hypothetical protein